jgi:energy-coupling factor transporter ATP-binding protein EcfA2
VPGIRGPRRALSVRGLTVSYAEKPAVFSVDASFAAGAMTAIIGPNGAGKSTMLKACLGIVPRLSGEVDGVRPTGRARAAPHRLCPAAGQRRLGFPGDGSRRGEDGALPDHRACSVG